MPIADNSASLLLGLIAVGGICVAGFPDGAPVDVCVKPKPNRPYHGEAEPSLDKNPYEIIASSRIYQPGSQVTVTIRGSFFKGFFLQARDAKTHAWIGTWAQTANTKTHDECSGITHADPRNKKEATLIWNAPANAAGQVYFTFIMWRASRRLIVECINFVLRCARNNRVIDDFDDIPDYDVQDAPVHFQPRIYEVPVPTRQPEDPQHRPDAPCARRRSSPEVLMKMLSAIDELDGTKSRDIRVASDDNSRNEENQSGTKL